MVKNVEYFNAELLAEKMFFQILLTLEVLIIQKL